MALIHEKENLSYWQLYKKYDVNPYYLWNIVEDPDYKPPTHVKRKLGWIRQRPRRIAIRCDDMQSAARSIKNNLDSEQVKELIQELNHEGQEKDI